MVPFDERAAHAAGRVLAATKTTDVVDASVAVVAAASDATVLTSDPYDLERLGRATGKPVSIVRV